MFIEKLKEKPVIAGIRNLKDIPLALERGRDSIFTGRWYIWLNKNTKRG